MGLHLPSGHVLFEDCAIGAGGLEAEGQKVELILRGIPLLWRSEEVMRGVAQTWGHLMEVKEVVEEEAFPVIRMGVWRNAQTPIAPTLLLNLDGWKVRILVEVVGSGVGRSFAEVVKGPIGGREVGRSRTLAADGSEVVRVLARRSEAGEVTRLNSVELVAGETDRKRKGVMGGQSLSGAMFHDRGKMASGQKFNRMDRGVPVSEGAGAPPVASVRSGGVSVFSAPAIPGQQGMASQETIRVVREKVRVLKPVVLGGHVEKSNVGVCQEMDLIGRQVASEEPISPVGFSQSSSGPHSDHVLRRPGLGWAPYFGQFIHGPSDPDRQTSSGPPNPGNEPDRVSGGKWSYHMQEDGVVTWRWSPYPMQGRGRSDCESCDSSVGETGNANAGEEPVETYLQTDVPMVVYQRRLTGSSEHESRLLAPESSEGRLALVQCLPGKERSLVIGEEAGSAGAGTLSKVGDSGGAKPKLKIGVSRGADRENTVVSLSLEGEAAGRAKAAVRQGREGEEVGGVGEVYVESPGCVKASELGFLEGHSQFKGRFKEFISEGMFEEVQGEVGEDRRV
ncbi:hypothetical protein QJS10_CPA09g02029 [Acorus calamus]|uniref:DUF4283 domain-containing protein n=1 Tax=Acorus calamus TaxID=4465 RepID=A0AAV9E2T0_ACOCL|nr:hypothetical protein QJS10_CPA09g02029 [Acorus calamus]